MTRGADKAGISRRGFIGSLGATSIALSLPRSVLAVGQASQIDLVQLIYSGGNWEPRPTALRRLAWEIHKRTSVDTSLEPTQSKVGAVHLSLSPFAYLSGDRPFPAFDGAALDALGRFFRLGGTLVIDPAFTPEGDAQGFSKSVDDLMSAALPRVEPTRLSPGHLIYRTFYDLALPCGRVAGSPWLTGYETNGRIAAFRGDHDMGGAWARDNLGNWEHEVEGGEQRRENSFRLGINLLMYALCLDYKDEEPHRRFGRKQDAR